MIFTADLEIICETKRQKELVLQKIENETNLVWRATSRKPTQFIPYHSDVIYIGYDYITCGSSKEGLKEKRIKAEQII